MINCQENFLIVCFQDKIPNHNKWFILVELFGCLTFLGIITEDRANNLKIELINYDLNYYNESIGGIPSMSRIDLEHVFIHNVIAY